MSNTDEAVPRRELLKALVALPLATLAPTLARAQAPRTQLVFACGRDNDFFRVASASGLACSRYEQAAEAVAQAPEGSGVLLLAERYPVQANEVGPEVYQVAAKKKLRLYIEFPGPVPDLEVGFPTHIAYGKTHNLLERAVVASDVFAPALPRLRILDLHDCMYVPVSAQSAELYLARVAGFDTAVFGLPQQGLHPLLFQHSNHEILIAATKLSEFEKGRYGPSGAWPIILQWVLEWLAPALRPVELRCTPVVHPAWGRNQPLPAGAERHAIRNGIAWLSNAKLLVAPSWSAIVNEAATARSSFPAPLPSWPLGDGSDGVLEGLSSDIEWNGAQPVGWNVRADCTGEVAMAMAFAGMIEQQPDKSKIATNLNDFIYFNSALASGPRSDPQSPSFGLLGWSVPKAPEIYYGDDNARSLLGTMAASGLLKSSRWDEHVLRCLLANLRTTGALGFRRSMLSEDELRKFGWRHFYEERSVNFHPHYEAYLWACFLRAYERTHYAPFLDRAGTAIRMTVAAYPGRWHWTNGLQQERARMLLPLAWLIRVQDTAEHRQWLRNIAKDLLSFQDESGAIREEVGSAGEGQYRPPNANDQYGTSEAPLIQRNGDPVSDLLYTTNFAFLGLHEAAAVTGDPLYASAENQLAQFLCRIQVQSASHPELVGGWFRAFDYERWDYWASASDWGWGPWSIETGWTQSWICAVLAMRDRRTSLWDVTGQSLLGGNFDHLRSLMFS